VKGDYRVNQVVLLGSWNEGRGLAMQELEATGITSPFAFMQANGGYDMFSPFGDGKMVLVETELQEGERHESLEEQDKAPMSAMSNTADNMSNVADGEDLEPDIDDVAGIVELQTPNSDSNIVHARVEVPTPWVELSSGSKPTHKSSVLRLYSNPLSITSNSHDRLKRVRGYSRYNEPTKASPEPSSNLNVEDNALCIQDPVLTLVRADDRVFLAICQVLAIRRDGKNLHSLSPQLLPEPNVLLQVQIMKIEQILRANADLEALRPDWEWTGALEHRGTLKDIPGRYFSQVNPVYEPASRSATPGADTYVFETAELRTMCAILYERLYDDRLHLAAVAVTPSFPYRNTAGTISYISDKYPPG
jgi:hypothetical protein